MKPLKKFQNWVLLLPWDTNFFLTVFFTTTITASELVPYEATLTPYTPQTRMWSREVKAWTGQPDKLTCASALYLVSFLTCKN